MPPDVVRRQVELGGDARDVFLDRAAAQHERVGDAPVRRPTRDQGEDLPFAVDQPVEDRPRALLPGGDQHVDDLGFEDAATVGRRGDRVPELREVTDAFLGR